MFPTLAIFSYSPLNICTLYLHAKTDTQANQKARNNLPSYFAHCPIDVALAELIDSRFNVFSNSLRLQNHSS